MRRNLQHASSVQRGVDLWLALALLALMCFGVLMVYSASMASAYTFYKTPYYYLTRELVWTVLGGIALLVMTRISYHRWERWALPLFGCAVALLILVMVPSIGHSSHGARRWISFTSSVAIEPSELVKLALIVYLAAWLRTKGDQVRDFKACFVPFSMIVGMIALLIIRQPDLGTAIVVTATATAVLFVAGASLAHLASVAIGASVVAWVLAHSTGYRHDRLVAFLNPWQDPTGVGYHTIQALTALRSGGIFGQGLGNSIQKWVLPAPHTDSILAVIGEELGMVGALAILLLFLVVAYRGIRISATAPDVFGRLLAAGITSWITFQALMNFAVITSSVPFTGVPLPFVSYGGTSLVITMMAIGILMNISRHCTGEGFANQDIDNRRGDRRTRVPRVIHRSSSTRDTDIDAGSQSRDSVAARPRSTRHRSRPVKQDVNDDPRVE